VGAEVTEAKLQIWL